MISGKRPVEVNPQGDTLADWVRKMNLLLYSVLLDYLVLSSNAFVNLRYTG